LSDPGKKHKPLWTDPAVTGVKAPPITPVHEADRAAHDAAFNYAKMRTPETADAFLGAINPWIESAVRTYGGKDAHPVLKTEAKLLALNATPNFKPDSGVKLRTYLMSHWQGLRRKSPRLDIPVSVPERIGIDASRIRRHAEDLEADLGRPPSDHELADRTGLPMDRIAKARNAGRIRVGADPDDDVREGLSDKFKTAWMNFIHADLSPQDQLVLEHTVGLNNKEKLSTSQLATMLKVTPGAISQRREKIQKMLDEYKAVTE